MLEEEGQGRIVVKSEIENKWLSIIIPIYNTPLNQIENCLNSVLGLTIPSEVLLVNDGSVMELSRAYKKIEKKDRRIKLIEKKNGGVSSARNEGINEAEGTYVFFVDSDDTIPESLVEYINVQWKNLQDDWMIFPFQEIDLVRKVNKKMDIFTEGKITHQTVVKVMLNGSEKMNSVWGKIIKRSILVENKIEFPIGVLQGEDLLFNIRLLNFVESISYTDVCGYCYLKASHAEKRLLSNIYARFDDLKIRYQELGLLIDKYIDENEYNQYHLLLNNIFIYTVGRDCMDISTNKMLDDKFKIFIKEWIVDSNILHGVSLRNIKNFRTKIYYFALKKNMWRIFYILGFIKRNILKKIRRL